MCLTVLVLVVLTFAGTALGEDHQIPQLAEATATSLNLTESKIAEVIRYPQNAESNSSFWFLSAVLVASSIYDIESTFRGIERCGRCGESNPLMRPFVNAGRPTAYGIQMGINAGIILLGHKARKNESKMWWLPQAMAIGVHSFSASLNMRF